MPTLAKKSFVAAKILLLTLYFALNLILLQSACQYWYMTFEIVSILSKEV